MATAVEGAPVLGHPRLAMAVAVDLEEATAHLSALGARFADLVESIERPGQRAHGLDWTVAETAVHVLQGLRYYSACIRGEDTSAVAPPRPEETFSAYVARENKSQIDAEPERDPARIAARIRPALQELVNAAREAGPDAIGVFAAGYSEDTTTSICTFLGELVVHGYDIARATGAKWTVDRRAAVLAVYSTTAAAPLALNRDAAAGRDIHVKIRLRHGSPFSLRFRDGRVWTE